MLKLQLQAEIIQFSDHISSFRNKFRGDLQNFLPLGLFSSLLSDIELLSNSLHSFLLNIWLSKWHAWECFQQPYHYLSAHTTIGYEWLSYDNYKASCMRLIVKVLFYEICYKIAIKLAWSYLKCHWTYVISTCIPWGFVF